MRTTSLYTRDFVFNRFPISFRLVFLFGFSSFRGVRRLDVETVVNATRTRRRHNVYIVRARVSTSISTYACIIYVRPYEDHILLISVYTHIYYCYYGQTREKRVERGPRARARARTRVFYNRHNIIIVCVSEPRRVVNVIVIVRSGGECENRSNRITLFFFPK